MMKLIKAINIRNNIIGVRTPYLLILELSVFWPRFSWPRFSRFSEMASRHVTCLHGSVEKSINRIQSVALMGVISCNATFSIR